MINLVFSSENVQVARLNLILLLYQDSHVLVCIEQIILDDGLQHWLRDLMLSLVFM